MNFWLELRLIPGDRSDIALMSEYAHICWTVMGFRASFFWAISLNVAVSLN